MALAAEIIKLPRPDGSKQFLNGVKKILQDFKTLGTSESKDGICSNLACLVQLYLSCPSRLAAKRAMASFFQGLDDFSRGEFEHQLCHQLKECLHIDTSLDGINAATRQRVDIINSLMENFKLGERCLFKTFSHVVSFLIQAEKHFLSGFGPDVPPVSLNEVMLNCHVTMQTINLFLQKTAADCPERINELLARPEQLSNLMDLDIEILHNDLFLLDCRCGSAMNVFILLQLTLPGSSAADVVSMGSWWGLLIPSMLLPEAMGTSEPVYPNWLSKVHVSNLALNTSRPLTFLALTFGYIAMVTSRCISNRLASNNNSFYLDVLLSQILHVGKSCEDTASKTLYAKTVNLWTSKLLSAIEQETVSDQLAFEMRGECHVMGSLLDYVWTHWEDQLDVLYQSAKSVFENVLKFHVKACTITCVDSTPFILSLVNKVLAVSWSSRGKYGALTSCTNHVAATELLNVRPSLPSEVLQQHQEQAVSCYASELYCCLFLSHKKELISSTSSKDCEEKTQPSDINDMKLHTVVSFHHLPEKQHLALMEAWIHPVIMALHSSQSRWKQNIIEYLLPKLMKTDVGILDFMIEKMSSSKGSESDVNQAYGAIIMCLRRARAIGLLKSKPQSNPNGLWFGILHPSILKSTLCCLNEQIRLDAFALLCDNRKTSEAISSFEFDMLQSFIPDNVNSQSPAFRQAFLALLKKLFFRLKESLGLLNRLVVRNKSPPSLASIETYETFLTWLTSLCLSNIYPGSTFALRTTCLACLTLMISFFNSSKDGFSVLDQVTQDHLQSFIECVTDTFEENKKEALSFLTSYTQTVGRVVTPERLKRILDICFTLAISTKPQDCTTAAYLFELLLKQPDVWKVLQDFQPFLKSDKLKSKLKQVNSTFTSSTLLSLESTAKTTYSTTTAQIVSTSYLLNLLCLSLNDQIEVARSSLVTAAANRPMYPTLQCIRYIMKTLKWTAVTNSLLPLIKEFINNLIITCLNLADVVSPVVQNSSPEGNVPAQAILSPELNISDILHSLNIGDNDGSKVYTKFHSHSAKNEHEMKGQLKPTTQEQAQSLILSQTLVEAMPEYLVVCCWRSIKEVSLVLGKLCLQIPVSQIGQSLITGGVSESDTSDSSFLMSLDQVKVIGQYFTRQLLESIHRGAFELAYAGFQLMCQMLWSHPSPAFHKLPPEWLQQVMIDIKSPQSNLCATRRSAGVPFFIQAITSSEPSATGRICFDSCIQELLVLAVGQGQVSDGHKDAQIHALNILRTLYRDAKLREEVVPHVADGLKAAVLGFKSDLWVVRNSATLLLSALMTRIFGVKRSKDESAMSMKNCLTGRVFFHRYPSLYQFLLDELKSATATVGRQDIIHLHPSLYPILLVLGRLFPSTLEGADTSLSLSAFIPYVLKCASSPVFKTRVIAARALHPLAKRSQVTAIMEELLNYFPTSVFSHISSSLVHGVLLQLRQLMKLVSGFNNILKEKVLSIFISKFMSCSWLLSSQNPCCATRQEALKLVDAVLDLSKSVSPANEDLKRNVRCLQACFLSSLTDLSSETLKWKPFFHDFEKTRANLTVKHLLTVLNPSTDVNHQQDSDIAGCDDENLQEEKNRGDDSFKFREKIVLNLLGSPYYEVRLEALNGMIISMETQSCVSSIKETDAEESCSDDILTPSQEMEESRADWSEIGEDNDWMPAKVSSESKAMMRKLSAGLFDSLLAMAMEQEDHHECVEKVFHLLAVIPDYAYLLRNIGQADLKKVFSNLLHKIETERRTQVKASMLKFSSRIVPHLYDGLKSSKEENPDEVSQLRKWVDLQTGYSRNDADPELQLSAAFSFMNNASLLLCDPQQKLGVLSLLCWDVMAILLQADDLEVKDVASSALAAACGQHRDALHPNYVLHKLPDFLILLQAKLGFSKLFMCLVSWILLEEVPDEKDSEERLFERGEMNTYWDQIAFSRSVGYILTQVVQRLQEDSTSSFGGQDFDKIEIEEFISITVLKLVRKLEVYKENVNMSDAFTNPGKYTDAYQAIYHANILTLIFKECQNLNVSLPHEFFSLEKLIIKIKETLHMCNL